MHVAMPCMDDQQLSLEDFTVKGWWQAVASRTLLKILCIATVDRPDVLWAVNDLAQNVTKWNVVCDRRQHRLISYLEHTREWIQT